MSSSAARASSPAEGARPLRWSDVSVVGESFYQDAIHRVLRARGIGGDRVNVEVRATLVPEPRNPHDHNAVAVHVDGMQVAHLARAVARRYQRSILDLNKRGLQVEIDAQLIGHSASDVGVFLRLPAPDQLDRLF